MDRNMDMRYDGRNPYGSEGGYVVSSRGRGRGRGRGRRGDRSMDYGYDGRTIRSYPTMHPQGDYRGDMNYDMARGGRGDYGDYDMARGDSRSDMRGGDMRDYGDMRMRDGHHMGGRGGYEPVEFMGYCSGYYGSPQDHGRGRDYGYGDMRGDYRGDYRRGDYGYDYGDYGETLSEKELDEWCNKLKSKLDEREKQMFSKEIITQKAKQMGKEMKDFGEKELEVVTLMLLDDYKHTLGVNADVMVKLAFDWLNDEDAKLRGAEKLAVYFDEIVMGGEG